MGATEHPLCIFFEAGGTRYALRAVSVLEIATSMPSAVTGAAAPPRGDDFVELSRLLWGQREAAPGVALVLDRGPTRGLWVGRVDGVAPVGDGDALSLGARLGAMLGPLVRGALVSGGRLALELDADAVATEVVRQAMASGGPENARPSRARPAVLELQTIGAPTQAALVFQAAGRRLGTELPFARHVVPKGPTWTPLPFGGACLGAFVHRDRLVPVYGVPPLTQPQELVVVVELEGTLVGLAASLAEGVRSPADLASVEVLDLVRMFS